LLLLLKVQPFGGRGGDRIQLDLRQGEQLQHVRLSFKPL
jgi:hypothetical protein